MKTIKLDEIPANANARDYLQGLDVSREEVLFEKNGQPHLLISSGKQVEQQRQAKERLFAVIESLHRQNPGVNSEDVLHELEEIDHPERAES
jgi:hypothetical protein